LADGYTYHLDTEIAYFHVCFVCYPAIKLKLTDVQQQVKIMLLPSFMHSTGWWTLCARCFGLNAVFESSSVGILLVLRYLKQGLKSPSVRCLRMHVHL